MSRAVAGHAASIGIAGALSFVFAGALGQWLGQIESLARQPVWALLPDVPEVE